MDKEINIITANTLVIKDIYGRTSYINIDEKLYDSLMRDYVEGRLNRVLLKRQLLNVIFSELSLEEEELTEVFDLGDGIDLL